MTIRQLAAALVVLLGLGTVAAAPAQAIELEAALRQGLVGEKPDGYLGAVGNASAEVQALIKKVNDWRRGQYLELSNKHNQPLPQIEAVAGKTRIENAPSGTYIWRGGQWVEKP